MHNEYQFLLFAQVWSVDTDDFLGNCKTDLNTFSDFKPAAGITLTIPKRYNNNYPLLRTINEAIVISLDEIALEAEIKEKEKENEIPHDKDKGNGSSSSTHRSIFTSGYVIIISSVIHKMLQ